MCDQGDYVTLRTGGGGAVTIEVQCTSCHTRYRIDEQVLPEGTPTFKCSRCGHVFSFEPRPARAGTEQAAPAREANPRRVARPATPEPAAASEIRPKAEPQWVTGIEQPRAPTPQARSTPAAARPAPTVAPKPPPAETAPPASAPGTDELMARPIRETPPDPQAPVGNTPRFDFADEKPALEEPLEPAATDAPEMLDDANEWSVGDDAAFADAPAPDRAAPPPPAVAEAAESIPIERPRAPRKPRKKPDPDADFVDETEAPIYNHEVTHSARFALALMLLVAIGYGAATMLVRSAPAAAAELLSRMPLIGERFVMPITPARLVALRAVHADYLPTKGGHNSLVITGIAENVGDNPLHAVRIAVALRDAARRPLADRAIYCGNTLSAAMVAQMTPHEIEFFQKLDPPKTFALEPTATTTFVVVFVDPPAGATRFEVAVASAVAAASAPAVAG